MRKDRLDGFGFAALLGVAAILAVNQIVIKLVDRGLQPVFLAGARSALAAVFVGVLLWRRGLWNRVRRADLGPGLLIGTVFAVEFLGLFTALDLTTVGHASLIMYSMPVWMGILAHFFLPGERATPVKAVGLVLAFAGTGWAIASRSGAQAGQVSWLGDFCALIGAWGWAGTAFLARATRLREAGPEAQLFWMVLVSAPILLAVAPLFGPLIRDVSAMDWVWLLFQAGVVVTGGFVTWMWLLSVYPTSTVASFAFLTPIMAILLGHLVFGESLSLTLLGAAGLVSVGIAVINRKAS
ncbi:EamA family transporter [bacterium]|nr:EamA family transporter [bacterium]